jgi:hypothetical protein
MKVNILNKRVIILISVSISAEVLNIFYNFSLILINDLYFDKRSILNKYFKLLLIFKESIIRETSAIRSKKKVY